MTVDQTHAELEDASLGLRQTLEHPAQRCGQLRDPLVDPVGAWTTAALRFLTGA
jgi:hypothetical protein